MHHSVSLYIHHVWTALYRILWTALRKYSILCLLIVNEFKERLFICVFTGVYDVFILVR